jgi:hypothetical protein
MKNLTSITNWNTHCITIRNFKLTFWQRKGFEAITLLHWGTIGFADKFIMWQAMSDLEKRKILKEAREIRNWSRKEMCSECGKEIE